MLIKKTMSKDIQELLIYLKEKKLNIMTVDFGIIRDEATSCGNISNICYPDEELGENRLYPKFMELCCKTGV